MKPVPERLRPTATWERVVDDLKEGVDGFLDEPAFEETLSGLQMRELSNPAVFHRLFGVSAAQ